MSDYKILSSFRRARGIHASPLLGYGKNKMSSVIVSIWTANDRMYI
jgi:hypothetical protein